MEYKARNIVGEKLIKLFEKYHDKEWSWSDISSNPNITMDIIEANPDKPWIWSSMGISSNPNLTMDFINANSDKPWNWECRGISLNGFTCEYNIELHKLYLKKHKESTKKVFEELEEVLLNPDYMEMAKKLGVYSGLSSEW